jgi:aminopeptidase N
MRTTSAPLIRLKNYTAPKFTIDTVDLTVSFEPEQTRVKSQLQVKRAKATKPSAPLVLDGDELKLISVSVNGTPIDSYKVSEEHLTISDLPKAATFTVEIETELSPVTNTKLMGLYQSNGIYCTQCEAEGFRRITYFLDRPDVLSTYTVRLEGDRDASPILLGNGNPGKKGKLKNNRHYAIWHDPHPKPCYLFATFRYGRFETVHGLGRRKIRLRIRSRRVQHCCRFRFQYGRNGKQGFERL